MSHPPGTRLDRNALSLSQIVGSTLANIGPALGVISGFGLITAAAGVAAPITIVVAMCAILFLCNTLAQFSRFQPSAGSFVTFIGMAFGPAASAAASLFVILGYCVAAAAIVAIAGSWVHDFLRVYLGLSVVWQPVSVLSTVGTAWLVCRGIGVSTRWATLFFYFEVALLAVSACALLWLNREFLSLAPFEWSQMSGGVKGLGLGFPFAIYLFVGWENSAMLAEETKNPRRNVPIALFVGTLTVGVIYLILAYSVEMAFHLDAAALGKSDNPFMDAIKKTYAPFALVVYCASLTSLLSCLIGLTNGQARILFNSAREGLLPAVFARVHPRYHTPYVAVMSYIGVSCAIVLICGVSLDAMTIFNETGTLGTIVLILTYSATNLALPVYVLRSRRAVFNPLLHLAVPLGGTSLMLIPLWGLIQPGQPFPYDYFPWMALVFLVFAALYGVIVSRRSPGLAEQIGTYVADAE